MHHLLCPLKVRVLILPVFITALVFGEVSAATIRVPSVFPTISKALAHAKKGDTVLVADGSYAGQIRVGANIALMAEHPHAAVIVGKSIGNNVTLRNGSTLSGFTICKGRVGVYSEGASITISKCFIRDNIQSGVSSVGQLPLIQDNVIARNGGSGIEGWDVRNTNTSISHNTIAYNGNNGVALGGNSEAGAENNIIANNGQFGFKIDPTAKVTLKSNDFFMNVDFMAALPDGNFNTDPGFVNAGVSDFRLKDDSGCRNQSIDGGDLGSRVFSNGN